MASPLAVSIESVLDELAGEGMSDYLAELGDATRRNRIITRQIQEAQSSLENELEIYFFQKRVMSRPVRSAKHRRTATAANDYDVLEDRYAYFKDNFRFGGVIFTRRRPIVSVESVRLTYGGDPDEFIILNFPQQWVVHEAKLGAVHIQPLFGSGAVTSGSLSLVMLGRGILQWDAVPLALAVDYTTGFLPTNYVPDVDDPEDFCPDHDVRELLSALRYKSAGNMLGILNRALGAGGGSISMDNLSESFQANRFALEIQAYDLKVQKIIDSYRRKHTPPQMFMA